MLDSFNPMPWDPDKPAKQLAAYSLSGIVAGDVQPVLSLKDINGNRYDFAVSPDDAEKISESLAGFSQRLKHDGAAVRAELLEAAELESIVPYGN